MALAKAVSFVGEDLAVGTVQEHPSPDGTPPQDDHTQWTSVSDLVERRYYIRTYDNQSIRMISLDELMAYEQSMRVPINQPARYVDVTREAQLLDSNAG